MPEFGHYNCTSDKEALVGFDSYNQSCLKVNWAKRGVGDSSGFGGANVSHSTELWPSAQLCWHLIWRKCIDAG